MKGQRIDDHSCWCGGMSEKSVLPQGNKVKTYQSSESCGEVYHYEDSDSAIKMNQDMNARKAKSQKQKEYYRN